MLMQFEWQLIQELRKKYEIYKYNYLVDSEFDINFLKHKNFKKVSTLNHYLNYSRGAKIKINIGYY